MSLRKGATKDHPPVVQATDDPDASMTSEQLSHLKELSGRAGDPDAYDETLTRREAAKRIAALEVLLDHEEHSGVDRLPRT